MQRFVIGHRSLIIDHWSLSGGEGEGLADEEAEAIVKVRTECGAIVFEDKNNGGAELEAAQFVTFAIEARL